MSFRTGLLLVCAMASGCAIERADLETEGDEDLSIAPDSVVVDTSTAAARAQYDANVAFASKYVARCAEGPLQGGRATVAGRPRVLVTGFGRFLSNPTNATGQMVSALAGATYPLTTQPSEGADDPAPQTAVTRTTITLPKTGKVDVCTMVLPVYWDLAAILVIKELESFAPDFVMMNGIAGERQPIWLELGSVNRAMSLEDGSDVLRPQPQAGQSFAALVPSASKADEKRSLLLSWNAVKSAAITAIAAQGTTFSSIVEGAQLAGFPRASNTYLCNNVSYVVNYAMAYPGRTLTLLQSSQPLAGKVNRVRVTLNRDLRSKPRVFVHWPSTLDVKGGANVMKAIVDAQLTAIRTKSELPTFGNAAKAEVSEGGGTF